MFEFIRTNGIIWSICGVEGQEKQGDHLTPLKKNTLINISKLAKSWRNTSEASEDIAP